MWEDGRTIPFPPSLNEGEGGHEGKETTTTLTRREKRAVETGWSNFSQHFSSSSAGGANSVNNISGNAIAILITERPWGVSVVMLPPSVPCLRNFHPRTKTTFFCEACFHRFLFVFLFSFPPFFSHLCLRYTHRLLHPDQSSLRFHALGSFLSPVPLSNLSLSLVSLPSVFLFLSLSLTSEILNRGSLALIRRPATTQ